MRHSASMSFNQHVPDPISRMINDWALVPFSGEECINTLLTIRRGKWVCTCFAYDYSKSFSNYHCWLFAALSEFASAIILRLVTQSITRSDIDQVPRRQVVSRGNTELLPFPCMLNWSFNFACISSRQVLVIYFKYLHRRPAFSYWLIGSFKSTSTHCDPVIQHVISWMLGIVAWQMINYANEMFLQVRITRNLTTIVPIFSFEIKSICWSCLAIVEYQSVDLWQTCRDCVLHLSWSKPIIE